MADIDDKKGAVSTKTQLGTPDDVEGFVEVGWDEHVAIMECSTIGKSSTLGEAWIVGSATNGIVGTNIGTVSGEQQVVGGSGRVTTTERVVNLNNIFIEPFRDTTFQDTTISSQALWDTTNYRLVFGVASIAQSLTIFNNLENINTAKLIVTTSSPANFLYKLSSSSPASFETVTNNTLHTFSTVGQDLRFKIESSASATITELKVEYNKGI